MAKSLIVYGPAACGKTRNAEKIKALFGLKRIIDDVLAETDLGRDDTKDCLILTNFQPTRNDTWNSRYNVIAFESLPESVRS